MNALRCIFRPLLSAAFVRHSDALLTCIDGVAGADEVAAMEAA